MIRIEKECCDCGLPCKYNACPHYEVVRMFCDKCGDETEELYEYGTEELCKYCLLKAVPKIDIETVTREYPTR